LHYTARIQQMGQAQEAARKTLNFLGACDELLLVTQEASDYLELQRTGSVRPVQERATFFGRFGFAANIDLSWEHCEGDILLGLAEAHLIFSRQPHDLKSIRMTERHKLGSRSMRHSIISGMLLQAKPPWLLFLEEKRFLKALFRNSLGAIESYRFLYHSHLCRRLWRLLDIARQLGLRRYMQNTRRCRNAGISIRFHWYLFYKPRSFRGISPR